MRILFIIPLVLLSLVSFPSWADHIFVPYLDNYEEECKIGQVAPTGCYCTRDSKTGKCTETPPSQDKFWTYLKKKQHDEDIKAKACAKRLDGEPPVVVTPGVCRQASPTRIIGPCRATGSTRGTVAQTAAQRDQVTRRAVWRARVEHGTHALAAAESMSAVVAPLAGLSGALRHNRRRAPFSAENVRDDDAQMCRPRSAALTHVSAKAPRYPHAVTSAEAPSCPVCSRHVSVTASVW